MATASSKKKNTTKRMKVGLDAAPLDNGFEMCHWFFRDEIDPDTVSKILKKWVRDTFPSEDASAILANPDYNFSMYNGRAAAVYWLSKGLDIDDPRYSHYPEHLHKAYSDLIDPGKKILAARSSSSVSSKGRTLSPVELLAQKVNSTVLTELDEMEDEWIEGNKTSRDMYQLFKIHEIKGQAAITQVQEYVQGRLDELIGARDKTEKDLVEGYSHLSKKELGRMVGVYESMMSDLEKIKGAAKANRKPRKKKAKTADKQIKDLKYLNKDNEHRLTSIPPERVPGSIRLYTFNAKTRVLTEYVTLAKSGFTIKGTTIQNHDPESSRSVKLRKPDEFLSTVLNKTPRQVDKEWGKLTTKTSTGVSGRINSDTVLLKVLDK